MVERCSACKQPTDAVSSSTSNETKLPFHAKAMQAVSTKKSLPVQNTTARQSRTFSTIASEENSNTRLNHLIPVLPSETACQTTGTVPHEDNDDTDVVDAESEISPVVLRALAASVEECTNYAQNVVGQRRPRENNDFHPPSSRRKVEVDVDVLAKLVAKYSVNGGVSLPFSNNSFQSHTPSSTSSRGSGSDDLHASKLPYAAEASSPTFAWQGTLVSLIAVASISMQNFLPIDKRWVEARSLLRSDFVVGYSALECMLHVQESGSFLKRFGSGRGRAVATMLRWTMYYKVNALRKFAANKENTPVGESRDAEWLNSFTHDGRKVLATVTSGLDAIEGLKYEVIDGVSTLSRLHKPRSWTSLETPHSDRLMSLSRMRSAFKTNPSNMRAGLRKDNGAFVALFHLLRKIWSLGGVEEARANGFYYELAAESREDENTLASIPESTTLSKDFWDDAAEMEKADKANMDSLKLLITQHPRLTITAHYTCSVTAPQEELPPMSTERGRNSLLFSERPPSGRIVRGSRPLPYSPFVLNITKIITRWPHVVVQPHLIETVPFPPPRNFRYPCKKTINLHSIAAEVLLEFSRADSVEALLRVNRNSLRTVHVFALALSGVLRHALNESESALEKVARGAAIADASTSQDEVSLLFTSSAAEKSSKGKWSSAEEAKHFSMTYDQYVFEELSRMFSAGNWSPVPVGIPSVHDFSNDVGDCSMSLFHD